MRSANAGRQRAPSRRAMRRRGMALLVIVVLVMFVSLAAYRYSFEMENEYRLTRLQEEQVQARLCAQSGIEYAANLLEQPLQVRQALLMGEAPDEVFRRVVERTNLLEKSLVQDQQDAQWRFAILSGGPVGSQLAGAAGLPASSQSSSPASSQLSSQGGGVGQSSAGQSSAGQSSAGQSDQGPGGSVEWSWGMDNESAKLHIPTLLRWNQMKPGLARTVLMSLPEADEETVDGWLASLGVRTQTSASQDALQMAMGGGMQSNLQRQQRTRSLDRIRLRWLGGDLDQNYRMDAWEETLMERLLSDPMAGGSEMSPLGRELSKVNTVAMGQGSSGGMGTREPLAWNRYLTWVHGERNERPDGKPRIWLNQPDLKRLHQELSQVMPLSDANFIVAMRQHGPGAYATVSPGNAVGGPGGGISGGGTDRRSSKVAQQGVSGMGAGQGGASGGGGKSDPSAALLNSGQWVIDWGLPGRYTLKSALEMVDATLSIESAGASGTPGVAGTAGASRRPVRQTMSSPLASSVSDFKGRLAKLLMETTAVQQPIVEGRVDITSATALVLAAVPGLTQELAQKIVQARQQNAGLSSAGVSGSSPSIGSIGWLVEKGIVDWAKLRELEPHITTRSDVFSLQSVGFRDDRTPVFRSTVMIDARQLPARVRDQRFWHPWDRGFSTESLTQSVP
ncbi:MAG: helix-hairpin-helix domain-containing protein [Planctomycetota bacterium]|nr:helix-hairpin-helix domain-containing protein [Planctomycetota bacterium]